MIEKSLDVSVDETNDGDTKRSPILRSGMSGMETERLRHKKMRKNNIETEKQKLRMKCSVMSTMKMVLRTASSCNRFVGRTLYQ